MGGQPGAPATFGHHDALGPQAAERGTDRVAAHAVLLDEGELAGEPVVEGTRVKPPPQVRAKLGPQRQRAAAVQLAWRAGLAGGACRTGLAWRAGLADTASAAGHGSSRQCLYPWY